MFFVVIPYRYDDAIESADLGDQYIRERQDMRIKDGIRVGVGRLGRFKAPERVVDEIHEYLLVAIRVSSDVVALAGNDGQETRSRGCDSIIWFHDGPTDLELHWRS